MKISILLPFKNASRWIDATLKSICDQSHTNWELIAVNDHSEDDTLRYIAQIHDDRIRIVSNRGRGIIAALQTGLIEATGTYITRMDADDIMPRDKLKTLLNAIQPDRTVVTGHVNYFSSRSVSQGYKRYESWLNERCIRGDHFDHIYRECVVASPNWLISAAYLREDRIFEQLRYPEDYDMTFLWKKFGYHISSVDSVTHLWREHPDRTSRNSKVYDQESFFTLKLDWFRKMEKGRSLGVFGTGPKGKLVVEHLRDFFDIEWYDHEFNQYTSINGYTILDPKTCSSDLLLIAVYPEKREDLERFVLELGYSFGTNVWYV